MSSYEQAGVDVDPTADWIQTVSGPISAAGFFGSGSRFKVSRNNM
jgi:hypothetical protein